jgi:hypothetical protein
MKEVIEDILKSYLQRLQHEGWTSVDMSECADEIIAARTTRLVTILIPSGVSEKRMIKAKDSLISNGMLDANLVVVDGRNTMQFTAGSDIDENGVGQIGMLICSKLVSIF